MVLFHGRTEEMICRLDFLVNGDLAWLLPRVSLPKVTVLGDRVTGVGFEHGLVSITVTEETTSGVRAIRLVLDDPTALRKLSYRLIDAAQKLEARALDRMAPDDNTA